jgi:hypothetical protein
MFKKSILLTCLVLVCGLSLLSETGAGDLRPVGWWKLDEGTGTIVTDSSGNGITGHFTGNPAWTGGIYGGALRFDGASSVDFGNPPETVITGPLSIACWIKPGNLGTALSVEGHDRAFLARDGAYAFKASGPYLRFTTPRILDHDATRTILKVGMWQHVAVTFQPGRAGGCVFYLDGIETDRMTASALSAGTGPVRIAVNQWLGQFYTGLIDDVRLYSGALTQDEILRVMLDVEDWTLAWNPKPADGSTVKLNAATVLSWTPGAGAVQHDVYVGAGRSEVAQANTGALGVYRGRQTAPVYHLSDELAVGQRYYWRIDEVDTSGQLHKGTVWSFRVVSDLAIEDFETNDFSRFPWGCEGGTWTITPKESHSGLYSARAGPIGNDESSSLILTQDAQDGTVTFWCKVSCEDGADRLEFSIDGIKKGEWTGELDWKEASFPVEAGVRTFTWTYLKDSSSSLGEDTAWIDDITFSLGAPAELPAPALKGFDLYVDGVSPDFIASRPPNVGLLDYYCRDNPAAGSYCIHWTGVDQYGSISFRFKSIKDLSTQVDQGFVVELWTRCNSPNAQVDIRFLDTKTNQPGDHPWRMRYPINGNIARWNGEWNRLRIPLRQFSDHGAWDDNRWYPPPGAFDWKAVEWFEIVAEYYSLQGMHFYFDNIRVINPGSPG